MTIIKQIIKQIINTTTSIKTKTGIIRLI